MMKQNTMTLGTFDSSAANYLFWHMPKFLVFQIELDVISLKYNISLS